MTTLMIGAALAGATAVAVVGLRRRPPATR
jgi:hypothetical protein